MPYKNVHYIKIMLELLDDKRFIKACNDEQKLLYILWLCMAGLTRNNAEKDFEWFKTRFNLTQNVSKISENTTFLLKTFSKMYERNGCVKFKNFKKIHNPIRQSQGNPKDSLGSAYNIIEYNRIIREYIHVKGFPKDSLTDNDFLRFRAEIKILLTKAGGNGDTVIASIHWANKQKWRDWTLRAIINRWPDFMKHHKAVPKGLEEFRK